MFNDTPFLTCITLIKITNFIYSSSCFLGPSQHNRVPNSELLDLVFTSINDISVSISNYPITALHIYHPPLFLNFELIFINTVPRFLEVIVAKILFVTL
jgi:hypothetical protein